LKQLCGSGNAATDEAWAGGEANDRRCVRRSEVSKVALRLIYEAGRDWFGVSEASEHKIAAQRAAHPSIVRE
jgi:hypothetical protein